MIKIVSFDLDGTLVKSTFADKVWLEGLPKLYSKEKNIPVKQAKEFIYKLYEKVGENQKEWYDIDWWFKKFELKNSWQNLLNDYKHNIKSNSKKEFIEIQLNETNLIPFFKHVFSSLSDFNTVKKTLDVYKYVLSLLKIQSNEIIHVGDNKEFDYKSPQRIGIRSIYLNRKKTEKGNHIIFSLSELEKVVSNY